MSHFYLFFSSLLTLAALQGTCGLRFDVSSVHFDVINLAGSSPGGLRFTNEIGIEKAQQIMEKTTHFIWHMLHEMNPADRKQVENVSMFIDNYIGAEAMTFGNIINWNGAGQAPIGLIEGIADYTILKANYYPPAYAKRGQGDRWDQGYDFTARFLEYCESLRGGFVAVLNKKMKDSFNVNYFVELLGKPVDQLWSEYKAKYNGS
ncbi:hypothetical protein F0562_028720 [Nyssa sinensis]|uniref:Uncharacterized protein n=1 Tax=Nyssa sinensis TaxID=561372 RepID=A0A5J5B318_9ASTE|nr:hypothetical protein F0562_028720 [Nyssa sinensis]